MRFVALDLETTGLSPETDTIIEVAAVAFELEQDESGIWRTTNITEHSQLVYPEREMTEEISMITGITDSMLEGKPIWSDIRERVREFIGTESVIVGHNVLFDIAMLGTHGIDLSGHPVIDTFELSEIFSQDIESLNLGYLAGRYGLSAGDKEHRALGDTRLSVGLFVHYINHIQNLPENKKHILEIARKCEKQKNIGLLTEILGWKGDPDVSVVSTYEESFRTHDECSQIETNISCLNISKNDSTIPRSSDPKGETPSNTLMLTSLFPGEENEYSYLEKILEKESGGIIGVFGQEQVGHLIELLGKMGIRASAHEHASEYISDIELGTMIEQGAWERKEGILITKLLMWKEDTHTGLQRELKLYGVERTLIDYYRALPGEHISYIPDNEPIWKVINLKKALYHEYLDADTLIVKDIGLLEEQIRRSKSIHVNITEIASSLALYDGTEQIQKMLLWIASLYSEFPERPTGDNPYPPGEYGETYFFTQQEIWHHGFESLALMISTLEISYREWILSRCHRSRRDTIRFEKIDITIRFILRFHREQMSYNTILSINEGNITITYIPRNIEGFVEEFLTHYKRIYLSGIQIDGPKIREFLMRESMIDTEHIEIQGEKNKTNLTIDESIIGKLIRENNIGGTVILTTSMKHVRELGKSLEHTGKKILMQGISGGKGKQLGIFTKNTDDTILIGTIDMWRDCLPLWKNARNIILAKLPFDPPTDPYFLARTVGMKNNFALYSEPMIIIKLTILIERIMSTGFSGDIFCTDNRLGETIWGKNLMNEIV